MPGLWRYLKEEHRPWILRSVAEETWCAAWQVLAQRTLGRKAGVFCWGPVRVRMEEMDSDSTLGNAHCYRASEGGKGDDGPNNRRAPEVKD